jgi:hypothetical protein
MDKKTQEYRSKIWGKKRKKGNKRKQSWQEIDPYDGMVNQQKQGTRSFRDGQILPGSFENGKRR